MLTLHCGVQSHLIQIMNSKTEIDTGNTAQTPVRELILQ